MYGLIGRFLCNLPASTNYILTLLTLFIKMAAGGTCPSKDYMISQPRRAQFEVIFPFGIRKLYMYQSVKVRLDQETHEVWGLEEELDMDAVCYRFYSTYTASTLPRKILKGLQTSE